MTSAPNAEANFRAGSDVIGSIRTFQLVHEDLERASEYQPLPARYSLQDTYYIRAYVRANISRFFFYQIKLYEH